MKYNAVKYINGKIYKLSRKQAANWIREHRISVRCIRLRSPWTHTYYFAQGSPGQIEISAYWTVNDWWMLRVENKE